MVFIQNKSIRRKTMEILSLSLINLSLNHTSYLSFLLHRQDFRKPNFTPKKTTKDTKNTKDFLPKKWFWANFQWIFTRPFLTEGSSLQVEILWFCLFVRHHFNISNIGPSNHPRIMSDPTYYTSLERGGHQQ